MCINFTQLAAEERSALKSKADEILNPKTWSEETCVHADVSVCYLLSGNKRMSAFKKKSSNEILFGQKFPNFLIEEADLHVCYDRFLDSSIFEAFVDNKYM